mmetsp:Transcript_112529/g.211058  ORF Transcript_112529/g.211058 Transcript_112529/m.211058 type:complete len:87 (+) Transcript_112529:3978-4238(+)
MIPTEEDHIRCGKILTEEDHIRCGKMLANFQCLDRSKAKSFLAYAKSKSFLALLSKNFLACLRDFSCYRKKLDFFHMRACLYDNSI